MNKNDLAKRVTLIEGKKISISIAQVKEVMKIIFDEIRPLSDKDLDKILGRK